ncbi:MAG: Crp/Fnr family transcriptional regulator [Ectothiorhodospiraceae bacterium]|jgi:CRP/FNR family transcriptional regulator
MSTSRAAIDAAIAKGPLSRFPRDQVKRWLEAAVRLEAPPGSAIYHEHDEPRAGVVIHGLLRLYMTAPDGRQVTVRYARPGQLLGIPSVVGGPAPVSAQMLTHTVVLMLPVEALRRAGHEDADVAWLFAEEICWRLYDALEGLAGNAFGTLKQRACRHLLELAASSQTGNSLVAVVTQQELANAVGSARVAVARILAELRQGGLIRTGAAGIELLDPLAVHEAAWARE